MGDRRRRWSRCLRVFLLGGKHQCFDPTATLVRDAGGQRGVFEAIGWPTYVRVFVVDSHQAHVKTESQKRPYHPMLWPSALFRRRSHRRNQCRTCSACQQASQIRVPTFSNLVSLYTLSFLTLM